MSSNPLFPDSDQTPQDNAAVELIRSKVAQAYGGEPAAATELAKAEAARKPSKHQLYMRKLADSGKSLAEIQTAWHHYYTTLPEQEKHEVWQEFYAANQNTPYQKLFQQSQALKTQSPPPTRQPAIGSMVVADHQPYADSLSPQTKAASTKKLKKQLKNRLSANGKLKTRHHIQSILFGLSMGFLVLVVFLFTFFNEYIIAPFIQPSRNVNSTQIIVSAGDSLTASPTVIVPKINIQIPIDFSVSSNDENVIQSSLNNGTVHYPSTVMPGQIGNVAIFGHSSRNIFNNGKYKFAFALLHRLTTGDVFYITYNGKVYAYQVFAREIVPPSDVGVLNDTKGMSSTAMLITCDPPGFSVNRLVVWGQQISPDPTTNTPRTTTQTATAPQQITGNGPSLWSQFVNWLEFWN